MGAKEREGRKRSVRRRGRFRRDRKLRDLPLRILDSGKIEFDVEWSAYYDIFRPWWNRSQPARGFCMTRMGFFGEVEGVETADSESFAQGWQGRLLTQRI